MRKTLLLFFFFSLGWSFSQTIENVDFRAEGKSIVVTYDFFHPKADTLVNIELQFKDQQGSVISPKTISGDLKNVKPGQAKRIVWDALADGVVLSGKYKAELKIIQYNSVKIGNQVWMSENLNVSTFRNGDPIPEAKTNEEWDRAGANKQPAWCYYNNDPRNGAKYGKLYNWFAINDPRGLAPEGWHVSNLDDWNILDLYNKKTNLEKMNFKSFCGGTLSIEEGGFTFSDLNHYCEFWTSTDLIVDIVSSKLFCVHFLGYSLEENKIMWSFSEPKNSARYVRCVKD